MEKWSDGVSMENWNDGMLEWWNGGMMGRIRSFIATTHDSIPSFAGGDEKEFGN